jgi:hypothetical protein
MIFAIFGKNPAKMNCRNNLTTDFIRGYSHYAPPGHYLRSCEIYPFKNKKSYLFLNKIYLFESVCLKSVNFFTQSGNENNFTWVFKFVFHPIPLTPHLVF